jgi:hypothetical protein
MKQQKFDKVYNKLINEINEDIKLSQQRIINEGYFKDLFGGALAGGISTALITAAQGAMACLVPNIVAGLMIGLPAGAIAGSVVWLIHLIQDKIAKSEDEALINRLIERIKNKSFNIKDNEDLERLKAKYEQDIKDLAEKKNTETNVDPSKEI